MHSCIQNVPSLERRKPFPFLGPPLIPDSNAGGGKKSHVAIISFKPLKEKKASPKKKVQKIDI